MGGFEQSSSLFILQTALAWRLIAAAVLGAIMGLERSLAGKHAGMRTYALVSLGSSLFVIVGTLASYQLSAFSDINPLQIAASVAIGIGFIGSGLAALRGDQTPELTTAAGVWTVAAVGMACGYGFYILATTATALTVIIFTLFSRAESLLRTRWEMKRK